MFAVATTSLTPIGPANLCLKAMPCFAPTRLDVAAKLAGGSVDVLYDIKRNPRENREIKSSRSTSLGVPQTDVT